MQTQHDAPTQIKIQKLKVYIALIIFLHAKRYAASSFCRDIIRLVSSCAHITFLQSLVYAACEDDKKWEKLCIFSSLCEDTNINQNGC